MFAHAKTHRKTIVAATVALVGLFGIIPYGAHAARNNSASSEAIDSSTSPQLAADSVDSATPPADPITQRHAPTPTQAGEPASATGASNTAVTVNGQPIAVPENGSINQVIENSGGRTEVKIKSNSGKASVNLHVTSNSSSSSSSEPDE